MNDKIVVCLGKGGQREMAESFARKNNVPIVEKPGEQSESVMFECQGCISDRIWPDLSREILRICSTDVTSGRLSHEMLVRAAKSDGENLEGN